MTDLQGDRASKKVMAGFALAAAAMVLGPLALSRVVDQPDSERYEFEIPRGTAERLDAGEAVDIIPAELDLKLSDRLVLINNDVETHRIGAFTVDPGETVDRLFSEAASLGGYCSLHSDSRIDITIQ